MKKINKIIIKRKPKPEDWLPNPVEYYSWREEGVYLNSKGESWILPNNPRFLEWINEKFYDYRLDVEVDTHKSSSHGKRSQTSKGQPEVPPKTFKKNLFPYQKLLRDYISLHTPYRGVLAFHKLGSGKSRTSIAIAEPFREAGFKIVFLSPAALQNNFVDEIKTWGNPDLALPENFAELPTEEQIAVDAQRTKLIREKYTFVSYNGNNAVKKLSEIDFTNTVVIIDEVHNLLNMMTSSQSKQGRAIYKILMGAKNCRFVALSGTPLLNFGYELGLLFNILRGYMTQGKFNNIPLFPENELEFEQYFVDYITEKAKNTELFKRRIVGLVSYYCGVQEELYPELILHDPVRVPMSGFQFSQYWVVRQEEKATEAKRPFNDRTKLNNFSGDGKISKTHMQKSKKYLVSNTFRPNSRQYCNFTFPDGINRPKSLSKKTREILAKLSLDMNPEKWTSKQRSEMEILFQKPQDSIEEEINEIEIEIDHEAYNEFVDSWNLIESKKESLELLVQTIESRGYLGQFNEIITRDEETLVLAPETQEAGIRRALKELSECQEIVLNSENLQKYSAKMAKMFSNMKSGPGSNGKKFIYSNFRTLEGVEIFSRVLQVNGYSLFNPNIVEHCSTPGLRYAIISGTETTELRRSILKAFNRKENAHGEYLMAILGTSSAAEGISLKHVRQIHIMEPWWNEVRLKQVIGRGRRIGSHLDLPEDERNVHVFQYLSVLSDIQKETLKKDPKEHETTDEHVFNKARSKAKINEQFIHILKEAAIDCILNAAHNLNLKNNIQSITIGRNTKYLYIPFINSENLLKYKDTTAPTQKKEESNLDQNTETLKFARFDFNFKGLADPKTGIPLYIGLISEKNGNTLFKKTIVYKSNDPKKLCFPAYALYDRVAAETSHEFLLRAYLVDKLGLVKRDEITESEKVLS